jgi:hypothetical protein
MNTDGEAVAGLAKVAKVADDKAVADLLEANNTALLTATTVDDKAVAAIVDAKTL